MGGGSKSISSRLFLCRNRSLALKGTGGGSSLDSVLFNSISRDLRGIGGGSSSTGTKPKFSS